MLFLSSSSYYIWLEKDKWMNKKEASALYYVDPAYYYDKDVTADECTTAKHTDNHRWQPSNCNDNHLALCQRMVRKY